MPLRGGWASNTARAACLGLPCCQHSGGPGPAGSGSGFSVRSRWDAPGVVTVSGSRRRLSGFPTRPAPNPPVR